MKAIRIVARILWLIVSAPVRWVRYERRLLRESSQGIPRHSDRVRDRERAA